MTFSASPKYSNVKKIFLADGDAFVLSSYKLLKILDTIKEIFPECEQVASYARFTDVIGKSIEELILLKRHGLQKLYLGLESGSPEILDMVNKKSSPELAIKAVKMLKKGGISTYLTVLLGLGGKKRSKEHILKTVEVLNAINPDYISLMTLLVNEEMELASDIQSGSFENLSPKELLEEALSLVKKMNVQDTVLRINHASNFINVEGLLPIEKKNIIRQIEDGLNKDLDIRNKYRSF